MQDIPQFVEKKNSLYGEAFLILVEIEYAPDSFIRWARTDARIEPSVTFEGEVWNAFPIGNPRRTQSARPEIPTFDLPVANPDRVLQSVLQNYIVEGKVGRLVIVDRDQLDDPTAKAEEWFTVETASANAREIVLTCKSVRFNPRRVRIPSQTMTRQEYPGLLGASRFRYI
jgi:hypothetical protein